jgi:hypothetical protein
LREGDDHNLMSNRSGGDPHPQYLQKTGGSVGGTLIFTQPVEFKKGIQIHTDPDPTDDPQGDTSWQGNTGTAHRVEMNASGGISFFGGLTVNAGTGFFAFGVSASMTWTSRSVSSTPYTVVPGDLILHVTTTPMTINLESSPVTDRVLLIKDTVGDTGTGGQEITIQPYFTHLIEGQASYQIASNFEAASLHFDGSNWWLW